MYEPVSGDFYAQVMLQCHFYTAGLAVYITLGVMNKNLLGFVVLVVAAANVYWGARVYSLMRATGTPEYVQACKGRAQQLSRFSKLSYLVVLVAVGLFYMS